MIKIAVLGYGTVGSGVVEVFRENRGSIAEKAGDEIGVRYVLDLREFPGDPVEEILVHDFDTIVSDPEVAIVVETMGGLHPAYEFTKAALCAGKSVCSSNKELVAAHGTELMRVARENGVNYLFEASCGGGIPIIRALRASLTADVIEGIAGILNGTTNYILTKMAEDGSDFGAALAEAQERGYAERSPEADVEGHDARRKIAILSSIAYGRFIDADEVSARGITAITPEDHCAAAALGKRIKLLGVSARSEAGVSAFVAPMLVSADSPLYAVNDVFNGILVRGNMLGDAMFYGSGAGKLPTASAVAADVIACAVHAGRDVMAGWSGEKQELIPFGQIRNRFFVRLPESAADEARTAFAGAEELRLDALPDQVCFLTEEMTEDAYAAKAAALPGLAGIRIFQA